MGALVFVGMWGLAGVARAQVPQTLVYAVYDSEDGARNAFDTMRQSERQGVINIDSFAVVSKNQSGRVRVHSTQRRGAVAGSVIGALIGVIGGPAGVAVGMGAGGGIGFLTGNAVGIPREDINAIKSALQPGTSAVIAVVDERWVADVERGLHQAQAKQVLDHKIAGGAQTGGAVTTPPTTPSTTPSTTPESNTPPSNP
jgi:uncharacterized membrane protein